MTCSIRQNEGILTSIGCVIMIEVQVRCLSVTPLSHFYQFHHGLFTNTIEPQYILILDDTTVIAIYLTPSIPVMRTLSLISSSITYGSIGTMRFCEEFICITSILRIRVDIQIVHS